MAEERIIDDDIDKNKKYRIVTGEDGEDELIIDEPEEEEQPSEEQEEEELVEDEELGLITPEELEAAKKLREEEEAKLKAQIEELTAKTAEYLANDKYSDALDCIAEVEKLSPDVGEIKCAKLEAITRKFTEFIETDDIVRASREVVYGATAEQRTGLYKKYGAGFEKTLKQNTDNLEKLNAEYAAEQQERREILSPRKKHALKNFIINAAFFAVFLIAAIICSTQMFSMQNGLMLYITIALAVVAAALLIVLIFTSRAFAQAAHMSRINEKDFSTKLGRERAALSEFCSVLNAVYSAICVDGNDIS